MKDREPFYKGFKGDSVVYLPGDISGLERILHLLATVLCRQHHSQERIGSCIGRIA